MNVLLYTPSARIGGVEVWSFTFFLQLLKEGIDTTLFSGESGVLADNLSIENKKSFVIGTFAELICYLNENPVDIIHFPSQAIDDGAGFIKSLFPKIKVVVTCHGAIPIGWTSKNCDQIISLAKWLCKPSARISGMDVSCIYNGIDFKKFNTENESKQTDDNPVILWVGRADDDIKGLSVLANIIDDIKMLGFAIWVITPSNKKDLTDQDLQYVSSKVDVWKSVEYQDIPNVFRAVSERNGLLLMTSKREGLGLVAIEAQACGCPVIGPNHTGIQESAIDKTLLFNCESEIVSLIQNTCLASNTHIKRGKLLSFEVKKVFELKKMTQSYIECYLTCLNRLSDNLKASRSLSEKVRGFVARVKYENYYFRKSIFKCTQVVVNELEQKKQFALSKQLKIKSTMYLFYI